MANILISGFTGFVGSNLCLYLKSAGYTVYGISRNKAPANTHVNKVFLWSDLEEIKNINFIAFIHLAGKAHDIKNISSASEYIEVNTNLTKTFFDFYLKTSCRDFIYFSSVKAVADTVNTILTEDVVADPLTAYGKSKLNAEKYLVSQKLPQDKRLIILRPCMIHGPKNKGNLNLLFQLVKKGIPYPLSAFENKRSFLSIYNLCFFIKMLLENSSVSPGIYNVADDEALSTNEVVETLATVLRKKPRLWKIPKQFLKTSALAGDKLKLPFNTERLKKLTENFVVSNQKIKDAIECKSLPLTSKQGLVKTIETFISDNV